MIEEQQRLADIKESALVIKESLSLLNEFCDGVIGYIEDLHKVIDNLKNELNISHRDEANKLDQ